MGAIRENIVSCKTLSIIPSRSAHMRGERISIRNFEEVRSQLVSEKDPVVKQKLSFLVVAGEDCLLSVF